MKQNIIILLRLALILLTVFCYKLGKAQDVKEMSWDSLTNLAWEQKEKNADYSILLARQALSIAENAKDSQKISKSQSYLAAAFEAQGNYPKALFHNFESLKYIDANNDQRSVSVAFNNIGNCYYQQKDYQQAILFYEKSLFHKKNIEDTQGIAAVLSNIGISLEKLSALDSALYYHKQSLGINRQLADTVRQAINLNNLGNLYLTKKEPNKALEYYKEAMLLLNNNEDNALVATMLNNTGIAFNMMDDYHKAILYAEAALKASYKTGNNLLRLNTFKQLAINYASLENYSTAYIFLIQHTELKDSVYDTERLQEIAKTRAIFETNQKDNEILFLSEKQQMQSKTILRNNIIISTLAILVVLSIIITFLLIQRNKLRTAGIKTGFQQKLLRTQMNPHFLFNALNSIQASILNNDKMQAYTYHSKFARLMRLILEQSKEECISLKDELESLQLYIEIEHFRSDERFTYSINVNQAIDLEQTKIPAMIIQPFVENAIWHGLLPNSEITGNLTIEIEMDNQFLLCKIQDNGIGLIKSKMLKNSSNESRKSIAIKLTHDRLTFLNKKNKGKSLIEIQDISEIDAEKTGTLVTLRIPLTNK